MKLQKVYIISRTNGVFQVGKTIYHLPTKKSYKVNSLPRNTEAVRVKIPRNTDIWQLLYKLVEAGI